MAEGDFHKLCLYYRKRWTTSFISAEQPRYNPFRLTGLKTPTIKKRLLRLMPGQLNQHKR